MHRPPQRETIQATEFEEAHRDDGRVGFVAIELTPRIATEPDFARAAEGTVRAAHTACIVTVALDVPVHVVPVVTAAEPALV